ncbi:MAG: molybdopterin converting factor subunit 1 [Candidatus Omnitrophica bacterium]|nr:molybdopterin converting factor subunit 1 [Candidatus Omnitrophota bacterium]MCA9426490.1 molybdopterin converting factor subunit 1 [Candidatus Omnitrophota bacterium]MCA9433845.1 molybdopterin converting factor subunit 1 [Candidatus Omnitrophota bacterium]MCA9434985.1 molybdopterin converting factor subunit 1 [Candidatus Omnitrophota bacterium]MCA9445159.1 molybdopterin converting factor subunit 1 [Candidatus Omnitrophota bacterium]
MRVRVLFFAGLRDLAGKREHEYTLDESSTLLDLHDRIHRDFPAMAGIEKKIRLAVNEEYATLDRPLRDGDTVAMIPPVSGG